MLLKNSVFIFWVMVHFLCHLSEKNLPILLIELNFQRTLMKRLNSIWQMMSQIFGASNPQTMKDINTFKTSSNFKPNWLSYKNG